MRPGTWLAAVAFCGLALGCGGGGEREERLTEGDLGRLVLQPRDLPPVFIRFDEGAQTSSDAGLGPRRDPRRFGRTGGWKARFRRPRSPTTGGPLVVESMVDAFGSSSGADRDDPEETRVTGNDQWFPWVDISPQGDLNLVFHDRRLDTTSTLHEWPTSRQFPGNYLSWLWGAVCRVTTTAEVTQETTSIPSGARQCQAPEARPVAQPDELIDPGSETQPGQFQSAFPLKNFTISDVPSNMDYSFRAGIFMGDYNNVAVSPNGVAHAFWTDARNGRSSRNQPGRNPACEQADVFIDSYSARSGGSARRPPRQDVIDAFSVTPCPAQAVEGP